MAASEAPLGASLPASFREMREQGELVDVHLIFGQTRVPCHRVVLAGTCDYFRRMFLSNMIESGATEVKMEGISASIGLLLVEYLYSTDIEVDSQNAQELLSVSSMLLLTELRKQIEEFLLEEIDVSNCLDFFNLSRLYDLSTLSKECRLFIISHINKIATDEVLCVLQEADFTELLMSTESHEARFRLLQRWTSSAEVNKSHFMDFMQHINLTQCSRHFVHEIVMSEQLMKNPVGTKLIEECLLYAAQHKSWIIVGDDDEDMWLRDDEQHWEMIAKPPTTATWYSACASPGGFILTGGEQDETAQHHCYLYHIHDKQWKTLPPMSTARSGHSSIHNDHNLYVVGGRRVEKSDSVETLDMRSLQWTNLPGLSVGSPLVAFASNSLFVIDVGLNELHEYSSSRGTWRERAPVPEEWDRGDVVCFEDHLYLVGGDEKICLRYNPRDDSWLSRQRPQSSHYDGLPLVWKDKILLCGGYDNDSIEEYSPTTDQWSTRTLDFPSNNVLIFALGD